MKRQPWSRRKQKKLDRAIQLIGWCLVAASCLSWLVPGVPLWITVYLCTTPWLALGVVTFGKGRFRLVGHETETVFNIVFIVPCGVMIGALLRFNVIDWEWPLAAASLGGAAFLAWCFVAGRQTPANAHASPRSAQETARGIVLLLR